MSAGIDPREAPIPVAPAMHYHMGGLVTDMWGKTTLQGLSAEDVVQNDVYVHDVDGAIDVRIAAGYSYCLFHLKESLNDEGGG